MTGFFFGLVCSCSSVQLASLQVWKSCVLPTYTLLFCIVMAGDSEPLHASICRRVLIRIIEPLANARRGLCWLACPVTIRSCPSGWLLIYNISSGIICQHIKWKKPAFFSAGLSLTFDDTLYRLGYCIPFLLHRQFYFTLIFWPTLIRFGFLIPFSPASFWYVVLCFAAIPLNVSPFFTV